MRIARKCKVCDVAFQAIKNTQLFCSRRCFKIDYSRRKKTEKAVENARVKVYDYACGICNRRSEMPFNPVKEQQRFAAYICPFCGIPRQTIWTHRYDSTFFFGTGTVQYIVSSAIVSQQQPS